MRRDMFRMLRDIALIVGVVLLVRFASLPILPRYIPFLDDALRIFEDVFIGIASLVHRLLR